MDNQRPKLTFKATEQELLALGFTKESIITLRQESKIKQRRTFSKWFEDNMENFMASGLFISGLGCMATLAIIVAVFLWAVVKMVTHVTN